MSLTGGKQIHVCIYPQRGKVREGEPKEALGRFLRHKEVHLCHAESFQNAIHHPAVQHSFPQPEFLSRQKVRRWFRTSGTWSALRDNKCSCAQRRSWHACLFRVHDRVPPWRLMWDSTTILSVLMMTWECARSRRKRVRARWTALNSRPFMCQARC